MVLPVDPSMRTPNSQSKHDQLRAKIVQVWRDRGHTEATIAHYLKCVERYRSHCLRLGVEEIGRLTRRSVDRFARAYARRRGRNANQCVEEARSSLHAWARAAAVAGLHVPDWVPPGKPGPFDAELARYCEFGRRWRGVKESTLDRESEVISCFLKWLRQHRQPLSSITLKIMVPQLNLWADPRVGACMALCGLTSLAPVVRASFRGDFVAPMRSQAGLDGDDVMIGCKTVESAASH